MKLLIALVWFFLLFGIGDAAADLDTPPDDSVPELVKQYLFMPCDAMIDSYAFQYREVSQLTKRLSGCHAVAKTSTYKYRHLMCLYIQLQWEYMYDHAKSVEKAHALMCDDEDKKHPEYKIEF